MSEPQISFDGAKWFCVVVEPGAHRAAEYFLGAAGFRTFAPKARRWISHARVKTAVERPLIGRYLFVEVDHPRQSFAAVQAAQGVESIISHMGIPSAMPRADVENLLQRYLNGAFDETAGALPIGARVCLMDGKFENWLATVTGRTAGGRYTVKPIGQQVELRRVYQHSLRPAVGFDLTRSTSIDAGGPL
jgi:transcription antitermination factor NusG